MPERQNYHSKNIGCLLYYALAIDATILVELADIARERAKSKGVTKRAVAWLLGYAASQPNAKNCYKQSDMKL